MRTIRDNVLYRRLKTDSLKLADLDKFIIFDSSPLEIVTYHRGEVLIICVRETICVRRERS